MTKRLEEEAGGAYTWRSVLMGWFRSVRLPAPLPCLERHGRALKGLQDANSPPPPTPTPTPTPPSHVRTLAVNPCGRFQPVVTILLIPAITCGRLLEEVTIPLDMTPGEVRPASGVSQRTSAAARRQQQPRPRHLTAQGTLLLQIQADDRSASGARLRTRAAAPPRPPGMASAAKCRGAGGGSESPLAESVASGISPCSTHAFCSSECSGGGRNSLNLFFLGRLFQRKLEKETLKK